MVHDSTITQCPPIIFALWYGFVVVEKIKNYCLNDVGTVRKSDVKKANPKKIKARRQKNAALQKKGAPATIIQSRHNVASKKSSKIIQIRNERHLYKKSVVDVFLKNEINYSAGTSKSIVRNKKNKNLQFQNTPHNHKIKNGLRFNKKTLLEAKRVKINYSNPQENKKYKMVQNFEENFCDPYESVEDIKKATSFKISPQLSDWMKEVHNIDNIKKSNENLFYDDREQLFASTLIVDKNVRRNVEDKILKENFDSLVKINDDNDFMRYFQSSNETCFAPLAHRYQSFDKNAISRKFKTGEFFDVLKKVIKNDAGKSDDVTRDKIRKITKEMADDIAEYTKQEIKLNVENDKNKEREIKSAIQLYRDKLKFFNAKCESLHEFKNAKKINHLYKNFSKSENLDLNRSKISDENNSEILIKTSKSKNRISSRSADFLKSKYKKSDHCINKNSVKSAKDSSLCNDPETKTSSLKDLKFSDFMAGCLLEDYKDCHNDMNESSCMQNLDIHGNDMKKSDGNINYTELIKTKNNENDTIEEFAYKIVSNEKEFMYEEHASKVTKSSSDIKNENNKFATCTNKSCSLEDLIIANNALNSTNENIDVINLQNILAYGLESKFSNLALLDLGVKNSSESYFENNDFCNSTLEIEDITSEDSKLQEPTNNNDIFWKNFETFITDQNIYDHEETMEKEEHQFIKNKFLCPKISEEVIDENYKQSSINYKIQEEDSTILKMNAENINIDKDLNFENRASTIFKEEDDIEILNLDQNTLSNFEKQKMPLGAYFDISKRIIDDIIFEIEFRNKVSKEVCMEANYEYKVTEVNHPIKRRIVENEGDFKNKNNGLYEYTDEKCEKMELTDESLHSNNLPTKHENIEALEMKNENSNVYDIEVKYFLDNLLDKVENINGNKIETILIKESKDNDCINEIIRSNDFSTTLKSDVQNISAKNSNTDMFISTSNSLTNFNQENEEMSQITTVNNANLRNDSISQTNNVYFTDLVKEEIGNYPCDNFEDCIEINDRVQSFEEERWGLWTGIKEYLWNIWSRSDEK